MGGVVCQGNGIYTIDLSHGGRSTSAAYLIVDGGQVAVIDVGGSGSVALILAALGTLGVRPEAVKWVILTHLHPNHCSGAGSLMCALPRAAMVAHPNIAHYLVSPADRKRQKKDNFFDIAQGLHEHIIPVDDRCMIPSRSGMELRLGNRVLKLLNTPGYAQHHVSVWDESAQGFFAGHAFGFSCREFDVGGRAFVFPSTLHEQFDPALMMESIAHMVAHCPQVMFLAHYGRVVGVDRLSHDLLRLIHAQVAIAQSARGDGIARHIELLSGLEELVREECARQQWALNQEISLNLLRPDLDLNARGLGMWLDHLRERQDIRKAVLEGMEEMAAQAA